MKFIVYQYVQGSCYNCGHFSIQRIFSCTIFRVQQSQLFPISQIVLFWLYCKSCSSTAPRYWNSLHQHLCDISSLLIFKQASVYSVLFKCLHSLLRDCPQYILHSVVFVSAVFVSFDSFVDFSCLCPVLICFVVIVCCHALQSLSLWRTTDWKIFVIKNY